MRIRPELDDEKLHRTIAAIRPEPQLHGLGAGTHAVWQPAADLLRATGQDWDRRVHRILVLARTMPVATIDGWVARRPQDPDALVVRACVQTTRAADLTSAGKARESCARAAEAYPEDPTPWIALLSLCRTLRVPVQRVARVWDEAVARDPWNRSAYHEMLRYLSPRECGSVFEMSDFAERSAKSAPGGSPLALLPVAAHAEHFGHRLRPDGGELLGASLHWHGTTVARKIDEALDHWFHAPAPAHAQVMADLNILAFALIKACRFDEAAAVFRRIGLHMTPFPWHIDPEPVRTFCYWRDRTDR